MSLRQLEFYFDANWFDVCLLGFLFCCWFVCSFSSSPPFKGTVSIRMEYRIHDLFVFAFVHVNLFCTGRETF